MDIMTVAEIGCAVVTAASGICALTPTPNPNTTLGKAYRIVEVLGLLVGKAKQTGIVPENPAVDAVAGDAVKVAAEVLGKSAPAFLIAAALAGALTACAGTTSTTALTDAGQVAAAIEATPAGRQLVAAANAEIAKINQKLGLTPAEVATLCNIDSVAHVAVQVGLAVSPAPAIAADADTAAHSAIAAACQVAEAGQLPSPDQVTAIVGQAQSVIAQIAPPKS